MEDLKISIFRSRGAAVVRNSTRTRNKTLRTPIYYNFNHDHSQGPEPPIFNEPPTAPLQAPNQDIGSDIDDGDINPDFITDLNDALSMLWHQFLVDIPARGPNRRSASAGSYIKLNEMESQNCDEATYKNTNLSDFFHVCRYKHATRDQWNLIFEYIWPSRENFSEGFIQNYSSMTYFKSRKEHEELLKTTLQVQKKH